MSDSLGTETVGLVTLGAMQPAPQLDDEADRLAALHATGVMQPGGEDRFDRITRTATRLLGVPIALISLVDTDRQWFKSRQGLELQETARSISFCGHAIAADDMFVIHDALADPRFADNPLVTGEPFVRFYAGQPLHSRAGHRVGTLCVIDHQPRQLSESDRQALEDLAWWAGREIRAREVRDHARSEWVNRLVQHASDGIILVDPAGDTIFVNETLARLVGRSADELAGRSVFDFIHPLDRDRAAASLAATAAESGPAPPLRMRLQLPTGVVEWVEIVANNLIDDPAVGGVLINVRDVTDRVELEQVRHDFLAVVSHEIRTPLTSIRGALGLLAGGVVGELPERAADMVGIALRNTETVIRLATDILDTERLEAGTFILDRQSVRVGDIVRLTLSAVDELRSTAGVTIDAEPLEETIEADAGRVVQALTNLLTNAIKFSPTGGVVRLATIGKGASVRFEVIDHGRGIPHDKLSAIFERYGQVERSDALVKGGTGLGLAITRGIVEAHGGTVGVASTLGEGSTFWFEIPRVVSAPC